MIVTIAVMLSIIPFKASDRYRLQTAALLTMFAAQALWYFFRLLKTHQKRAFFKWLAVLAIFCMICWPDWQNLAARKSARHQYFVGRHFEMTGRLQEAVKAYQKSMETFSWDADSPYRMGLIFSRLNQNQRAIEYLNLALEREPDFPEAINELARHHMRNGELIAAEKQLKKSLELAPVNERSLILMARLQQRKGNIKRETKYLEESIDKIRGYRSAMLLADRLADRGRHADAVGLYDWVMRSPRVDKLARVTAGMLAGFTTARYLGHTADDKVYWQYVSNEFDDFKFFALQAKFLNGTLPEKESD
jgi:tetratricopeptide (TPR) repeat protein